MVMKARGTAAPEQRERARKKALRMERLILLAVCAAGILAGSASAQQPGYYPESWVPVVDMGNGYRLQVGSPYYRPASMIPSYYSVGYSPAFHRGLTFPAHGPNTMPVDPRVYYPAGYPSYYRPLR